MSQSTLLVISGPSGTGKRPLVEALHRKCVFHEVPVHIHFTDGATVPGVQRIRTHEIVAIQSPRFVNDEVRGELNAVDLDELDEALDSNVPVVIVLHYTLAQKLVEHGRIRARAGAGLRIVTVFLSPFSEREIHACSHPDLVFPTIMQGRQLQRALTEAAEGRRARRMVEATESVGARERVRTTVAEIQARGWFDYQLTLRDGYLPFVWQADPPQGDGGQVLARLLMILGSS